MFDDLKDEMMTIPVDFYLGTFALNYLRFKADVKAGEFNLTYNRFGFIVPLWRRK